MKKFLLLNQEICSFEKTLFCIFLCLLFTITPYSLGVSSEWENAEAGSASLLVTIYDEDGEPVQGADITLYSIKRRMSKTGMRSGTTRRVVEDATADDGSVKIESLKPGVYKIKVYADGYMPEERSGIVLLDDDEKQVELRLSRANSVISGRVEDEEGRPLPEISVTFYVYGARGPKSIRTYESDEGGRFQCAGLEEGLYKIVFKKDGFLEKKVKNVPTGTTDLKVVLERGCAISGTILTSDGKIPGERVSIRFKRPWSSSPMTVGLDKRGRYRLEGIEPRKYRLSAETESLTSRQYVDVVLQSGQEAKEIDFRLYPGLSISGKVVSSKDGLPVSDISVSASTKTRGSQRSDRTGAHGKYCISRLNPGLYTVYPNLHTSKGREEMEQKITLQRGEHKENVNFNIELPPVIMVRGKVMKEDGSPAARAEINYITFRNKDEETVGRSPSSPVTYSDKKGEFTFTIKLFPKIIVMARDRGHSWSESEPLLTDSDTEEYDVEIKLRKGMAISGSVIDQEKQPLGGATVSLIRGKRTFTRDRTWRPIAEAITDGQGNYHFEHVSLGPATLLAFKEGFPRESKIITLTSGSDEDGYDFVLIPGGRIYGFVRDEQGQPLAGAMVSCPDRPGSRRHHWGQDNETDTTGYFEYGNLAQGPYELWVRHPDFLDLKKENVHPTDQPLTLTLKKGQELSGQVLSDDTGEPVEDFEIAMEKKEGAGGWKKIRSFFRAKVLYEAGGKFVVKNLADGEYKVVVEADGYELAEKAPLTVSSEKKPEPLSIALKKGCTIAGAVRSAETGAPVKVATVYVLDPRQQLHNLEERVLGGDWTNDKGEFKISGLREGDWSLLVSARGYSHYQIEHMPLSGYPSERSIEIFMETDPEEISPKEWRRKDFGFSFEFDEEKKAVVKKVYGGEAAQEAGLEPGDRIIAVDGESVGGPLEIVYRLRDTMGDPATIKVMREGEEVPMVIEIERGGRDPLLW